MDGRPLPQHVSGGPASPVVSLLNVNRSPCNCRLAPGLSVQLYRTVWVSLCQYSPPSWRGIIIIPRFWESISARVSSRVSSVLGRTLWISSRVLNRLPSPAGEAPPHRCPPPRNPRSTSGAGISSRCGVFGCTHVCVPSIALVVSLI